MVTIVTGPRGCGKTSLVRAMAEDAARQQGGAPTGFVSLRCADPRDGYDALCLRLSRRHPLLRSEPPNPSGTDRGEEARDRVGRFAIVPGAFARLNDLVAGFLRGGCATLVLDEIGMLELSGGGWAPSLRAASACCPPLSLFIAVRGSRCEEVVAAFGLRGARILRVPDLLGSAAQALQAERAGATEIAGSTALGQAEAQVLGELLRRAGKGRAEGGVDAQGGRPPELALSPLARRLLGLVREGGEGGVDPREAVGPAGPGEGRRLARLGLVVPLGPRRLVDAEACAAVVRRLLTGLGVGGQFRIGEIRRAGVYSRSEIEDLAATLEMAGALRRREGALELLRIPTAEDLVTAVRQRRLHDEDPRRRRPRRGRQ